MFTFPNTLHASGDTFTVLLLHMDGIDGANTIVDSSPSNHIFTARGNAQLDTAQKKFGASSLLLDGTGDYIDCPDSADFNFGSGDFTIECFVRLNSLSADNQTIIAQRGASNADASFRIRFDSTGDSFESFVYSGTDYAFINGTLAHTTGVWYHLALLRTGTTLKFFSGGVQDGGDVMFSGAVNNSSANLMVGNFDSGAAQWNGWVDEVRISKGIARWTSNFTPPSAPY